MQFYDVRVMLDGENRIRDFEFRNPVLSEAYRIHLGTNTGKSLFVLFPELEKSLRKKKGAETQEGELQWEMEQFCWRYIPVNEKGSIFLLKQAGDREFLMESTLDQITQGVQIYDRNGIAVYFNPATRKISGIPETMDIEGRHLLDLYEEDEEIKIIRSKKFDIKPMYPEDACLEMELLGHSFYVFNNAETDQVNVVYKRKGNTYGLIEPDV